ncbi:MAG: NUDIX domain-containing protein [Acidobacteriota bacterium]
MEAEIPQFGLLVSGVEYILRPGGYVVIFSSLGEVAVVSTPLGLYLPGGGQDLSESPEEAAVRETLEECGLQISLGKRIGIADELVFAAAESNYYRKRGVFFFAQVIGRVNTGEPDHKLIWITSERAVSELRHKSQRWAVYQACRLTSIAPDTAL